MALRSTVSSLGKPAEPGTLPAAPAPRLGRRPGAYKSPAGAPDLLAPDTETEQEEAPKASVPPPAPEELAPAPPPFKARKPRTPRAMKTSIPIAEFASDAKTTRKLISTVEDDIVELRTQMQKALARFQPKLEKLQAKHAELNATLVKQLTQ